MNTLDSVHSPARLGPLLALLLLSALWGYPPAAAGEEAASDDTPQPAAALPLQELRSFAEVFNQIRLGYVEEVEDKTLLEFAIRGMLNGLDPHSLYLSAADFDDLQTSTKGEFSGLGLEVSEENGFVKIVTPIDGTPADRAGLESGDIILTLDNQPTRGLTLNEAVALMRGPKGSSIELTIAREGLSAPFTVTLVRDIIQVVSVRKRWLEPGYAYLRIAQFQQATGEEVGRALASLQEQAELKGLVLDLRNNPGGVFSASVAVAGHFLDGGTVVHTEGRLQPGRTSYTATAKDSLADTPLVVLINGGSASAAEVVAGALQDRRRALIMGTDSFGKGSVQTILPLPREGAIKLTTALYFTPDGRSIQAQGIKPDIEVLRARITALENLPRPVAEADLNRHLENADGAAQQDEPAQPGDELRSRDNQLYEALTLLKGLYLLGRYEGS